MSSCRFGSVPRKLLRANITLGLIKISHYHELATFDVKKAFVLSRL
jgi:hypothetical protein